MLQSLNTRTVANTGLLVGLGTALGTLVHLLSDPSYLTALYWSIAHIKLHQFKPADVMPLAQLAGALFAILGALALSYVGRPSTIPPPSGSTAPPTKGNP